jgi:hypothetical protein
MNSKCTVYGFFHATYLGNPTIFGIPRHKQPQLFIDLLFHSAGGFSSSDPIMGNIPLRTLLLNAKGSWSLKLADTDVYH